jgi:hypothetical protein
MRRGDSGQLFAYGFAIWVVVVVLGHWVGWVWAGFGSGRAMWALVG